MIILGVDEQADRILKSSPGPGEAFVIFGPGGKTIVLETGQRFTPGEGRSRRGHKIVRINMAPQTMNTRIEVVSSDNFRNFSVDLTLVWAIDDARAAALSGISDVEPLIRTVVEKHASNLDRIHEFSSPGSSKLGGALVTALQSSVIEFITVSTVSARVELSSTAIEHLTAVQQIQDSSTLRQNELDLEKTTVKLSNELERLRVDHEIVIAKIRNEGEIGRLKERVNMYAALTGVTGLVNLQLASDPTKVDVVIKDARDNQIAMAQLELEAVKAMIDADAIEGSQMEDVAKRVLGGFLRIAQGELDTNYLGVDPPPSDLKKLDKPQNVVPPDET